MEYSPEQLNYFRICYVAFNLVPVGLRQIFKQEWDFLYKTTPLGEWIDTPQNGRHFCNKESRRSCTKNARYLATIQIGDTSEWDCSCLFFAILYSDSIGTTLSPAVSAAIDDIRQVRNDIAHINEGKLTDAEFQTYARRVSTAFSSLGVSIKEIVDIKNQRSFPTKEVESLKKEVLDLKSELDEAKTDLDETKSELGRTKSVLEATANTLVSMQANLCFAKEENETLKQELRFKLQPFCFLALKPPHEIIQRSSDIKRLSKKMQELHSNTKGEVSTIYLTGNPGCGKSQLARQLGSDFFSDNSDEMKFVATLNAESTETLAESYLNLGINLGLPDYTSTKLDTSKTERPVETIQQVQRFILSRVRQFSRWLMIVDNVVDLTAVRKLLPQTGSEEWGHGHVLITTQDSSAVPKNAPYTYQESFSRGMQPADAVELLEKVSEVSGGEQIAGVAKVLDYQPLALAAAAYYVQTVVKNGSPNYNWSMYLEVLSGRSQREATEKVLARESSAYPKSTTTAVKMALERVAKTDDVLCQAFQVFALCAADELPLHAVVQFVKVRVSDHPEELIKANILISSLILVSAEEEDQPQYLRLHNIVHEQLQQDAICKLKVDKNQNITEAVRIFKTLLDSSRDNRVLLNKLISHSKCVLEHMTPITEFVKESALLMTANEVVDWLGSFAGACIDLCDFSLAKYIADLACSLLDNIGEGALLKGKIFDRSGDVYGFIGEYNQAKEFYKKALMIRKTIFGEEHCPDVATSYNNLGGVYEKIGEYNQAKEFYEKALIIRKNNFSEEHRDVAESYNKLGCVHYYKAEYKQAKEFYEKALMIRKKIFDEEHRDVAQSYSNLGVVCANIGEYYQAKEFHEKALTIRKKIFGEEHRDVATSYNNLGRLFNCIKEYKQAKEFYEKALMIHKKIFGEEHCDVATSYNNLGCLYHDIEEYNQAQEFYEKALMIHKKIFGEEHPDVAVCYFNLGCLFHHIEEYNQAKEFYEMAMKIWKNVFGEEHRNIASGYYNLGCVFYDIEEHNQAKELFEKALMIRKKIFGEEYSDVAVCYFNLGCLYHHTEQYNQAKEFYERALMIDKKSFGKEHCKVEDCCYKLGQAYDDIGEYNQVDKQFYEKASMTQKTFFGGDRYPEEAQSYSNLGLAYNHTGGYRQANELAERPELCIGLDVKLPENRQSHLSMRTDCCCCVLF